VPDFDDDLDEDYDLDASDEETLDDDPDAAALRRAFGDATEDGEAWGDLADDSDELGEPDGAADANDVVDSEPLLEETAARLGEVYDEIVSRAPEHDFEPTLDRVQRVLDLLGDPQHNFRVVHITGTNGKTSTARMIEALVREHGLRTGLFTSPHLNSITERIQVDGKPLSAQRFIEVYDDVAPYIQMVDAESEAGGGPRLSFFEVLTVMAYAAFADAPVDVAVIEVGLGGTWDSTNVVDSDVAVITPIAMDHERWLGSNLVDIAENKAGIIKPTSVAISAAQRAIVEEVLADRARDVGATLLVEGGDVEGDASSGVGVPAGDLAVLDRQLAVGGQLVDLRTAHATYTDVFLPLHGAHQAHNALLALAATEELLGAGGPLGADVVEAGFASVTSPGRLELARTSPTILLDVAHNPHGAEALAAAVVEAFGFASLVGVVAVMADKDAEGILAALEPVLSDVVLTRNSSDRCADPGDLVPIADEIFGPERVSLVDDLAEAIQVATDLSDRGDEVGVGTGTGVLITGSVVTVADARILLRRTDG